MWLVVAALLAAQGRDTVRIGENRCAGCVIRLEKLATLGGDQPEASVGEAGVLVRDARGRYLHIHMGFRSGFLVFASDGRFQTSVGRVGAGPGEYRLPIHIAAAGNRIVVTDGVARRTQVYDLDLRLLDTWPGTPRPDALLLNTDGTWIMTGVVPTEAGAGYTVHLLNAKGQVDRHLALAPVPYREDLRSLFVRSLAADPDSRYYWMAHRLEYVWNRCERSTHRCVTYTRAVSWLPRPSLRPQAATSPPQPWLIGVVPDGSRYLWTVARVPDARWREAVDISRSVTMWGVSDRNRYHDTMVELVDLQTNTVVASQRFDAMLLVNESGTVWYYSEDGNGEPRLHVVRLTMNRMQ
jgi:hypothetical protein